MRIIAYGSPAPQGSKRFLGQTKLGRGIMVETSNKVTPWRSDVITACRHIDQEPLTGPVICRMIFSMPRPASVKRAKRPYPSIAPDLSKLCRATEDALQAAGVLRDDALIVEYTRLAKVYVDEDPEALDRPGALIIMMELVDSIPLGGTPPLERMRHAA